jgi:predicted ATP-dependent endonuclease of OLD family
MYVKVLRIQRFRGFRDLTIKPKGHVVVMGPPSSGRSDLIEALVRVLDPDASRTRTTTEIDFFNKQTSQPNELVQPFTALREIQAEVEDQDASELLSS